MRTYPKAAAGIAVTGAALIAAVGLAAAPAFAAVTTATVSGSSSTGALTATATSPTLTDSTTGTKLTCTSAAATATVANGTHTGGPSIQVGTITGATWNTCKLNSITFTVTANTLPWPLSATDPTTSAGNTNTVLTGITANLSGLCTATITGTVTGYYSNSAHSLVLNAGTLTVSGVGGLCLGLINNGDHVVYAASYVVSPTTLALNAS